MGGSPSKVAGKAAAGAAVTTRRIYPSTSSILTNATSNPDAQVRTAPPAGSNKSEHVDLDGRDPHFGSKLRQLGPAVPTADPRVPDSSLLTNSRPPLLVQRGRNVVSSKPGAGSVGPTNPAIVIVQARERIGKVWEEETESLGKGSFAGRTMLNAKEIADVLGKRAGGMSAAAIEKQMRLTSGLVSKLEQEGMLANV